MLGPKEFIDDAIEKIKAQIGDEKAIIALSGGVDSSVCSVLVGEAIGDNLTAVFVNHGLLREGEAEQVQEVFKDRLNFIYVDASDEFLSELEGVKDPEEKRKIIGRVFIEVFEREAEKVKNGENDTFKLTILRDAEEKDNMYPDARVLTRRFRFLENIVLFLSIVIFIILSVFLYYLLQ